MSQRMYVSPDDLHELTGLRRASAQIRWLRARGWAFQIRADGRPVVAQAEFEAQMCSGTGGQDRSEGPNLAALDRLG